MTCQSLKFLLLIQNGGRKIGRVVPTSGFVTDGIWNNLFSGVSFIF
jgi:hypothetical protein